MYNEVVTKLQKKYWSEDPYLDLVRVLHRLHIKFSSGTGAILVRPHFSNCGHSGLDVLDNSSMPVSIRTSFF